MPVGVITRSASLSTLLICLAGCIGTTPEEKAEAAQGPAFDGNAEHRPGQPCLVCHGTDHHPGGEAFILAGTVYRTASESDAHGLQDAEVNFLDADGREFSALTNTVGNFMVQVDESLAAPQRYVRGRLHIPWKPTFPLSVAVLYQGEDRAMESQIWREGSCAGCHWSGEPGVDHVEKVWQSEALP